MEGAKGLKDKESGKCIGKYKQQWRHKIIFVGGLKRVELWYPIIITNKSGRPRWD